MSTNVRHLLFCVTFEDTGSAEPFFIDTGTQETRMTIAEHRLE